MLLLDPSCDQGWEAKDIFQNLAEKRPSSNHLQSLLAKIGPHFDGILSCLDDLKEQARFCASTKSSTKFKLPTSEVRYARHLATQEWKDIELEFLLELSEALERNAERAAALVQKAAFVLDKPNPSIISKAKKNPKKQIQREIAQLKQQIEDQKNLAKMQEAAEAPYAALHCQATSYIGVCGFRLDEYSGTCLQLSYEHPIAGVESRFVFDLDDASWRASYVSDAFISSPNLLPANHTAAKFHEKMAKACYEDSDGLLYELQQSEVRDAVMLLSRWLGLLDIVTQELIDVSEDHQIAVIWPMVLVSISSECSLELLFDETVSNTLRPSRAVVSRFGREEDLSLPSGANFLRSLLAVVTTS